MRIAISGLALLVVLLGAYLLAWPVPVRPVAWESPPNPGYTGAFAANERLAPLELIELGELHGPEAAVEGPEGYIYTGTDGGIIVRIDPHGGSTERWADTGGRPLGLAFDEAGGIIVADARRGLLRITTSGGVDVLVDEVAGIRVGFADDVAIAADGRIYFSDASTKFASIDDPEHASTLDIVEHGGHGRLIEYDPRTGVAATLLDGLQFANGVAISHDQQSVLVVETGSYRVLRVWRNGARRGERDVLIDALPGMPDNITTGLGGRYWIAMFAPRVPALDATSTRPLLRKMLLRMPQRLRPRPAAYGHVIAVDDSGTVLFDLQDPAGRVAPNTSVLETADYLFVGSLRGPVLGRLRKARIGL